eukprot:8930016-Pyramimonas_sp.AAC.1
MGLLSTTSSSSLLSLQTLSFGPRGFGARRGDGGGAVGLRQLGWEVQRTCDQLTGCAPETH